MATVTLTYTLHACKCGCTAVGPKWASKARGYVVLCGDERCPAKSQAKSKLLAVDQWNHIASQL
jgi:hypothetical protein